MFGLFPGQDQAGPSPLIAIEYDSMAFESSSGTRKPLGFLPIRSPRPLSKSHFERLGSPEMRFLGYRLNFLQSLLWNSDS